MKEKFKTFSAALTCTVFLLCLACPTHADPMGNIDELIIETMKKTGKLDAGAQRQNRPVQRDQAAPRTERRQAPRAARPQAPRAQDPVRQPSRHLEEFQYFGPTYCRFGVSIPGDWLQQVVYDNSKAGVVLTDGIGACQITLFAGKNNGKSA